MDKVLSLIDTPQVKVVFHPVKTLANLAIANQFA